MPEPATLIEPSGMAQRMAAIGSTCRTSGAVKARVRTGYMTPTHLTERGIACWTVEGAARELRSESWRMRIAHGLGLSRDDTARLLQRWWPKEPVQLLLDGR